MVDQFDKFHTGNRNSSSCGRHSSFLGPSGTHGRCNGRSSIAAHAALFFFFCRPPLFPSPAQASLHATSHLYFPATQRQRLPETQHRRSPPAPKNDAIVALAAHGRAVERRPLPLKLMCKQYCSVVRHYLPPCMSICHIQRRRHGTHTRVRPVPHALLKNPPQSPGELRSSPGCCYSTPLPAIFATNIDSTTPKQAPQLAGCR